MLIQNGNIAKKKLQMGNITAATLPSQYQTTENPAASMGCGDDKVLGYQKILSFFLKAVAIFCYRHIFTPTAAACPLRPHKDFGFIQSQNINVADSFRLVLV